MTHWACFFWQFKKKKKKHFSRNRAGGMEEGKIDFVFPLVAKI